MIKIKDTYQEEGTSQETVTTSMEDLMAQRILKALDEHGEALKRMGGHLTRLEESKLKKPPHVENHDDEEEDEEWDEKDKVECERNKQFEKLTTETIVMSVRDRQGCLSKKRDFLVLFRAPLFLSKWCGVATYFLYKKIRKTKYKKRKRKKKKNT